MLAQSSSRPIDALRGPPRAYPSSRPKQEASPCSLPSSRPQPYSSLARLHAQRAPSFGLSYDNFIGTLVQDNRASSSFPAFFREHRLEPLAHHLPPTLRSALARLDLESRLVPTEPTLIHGDLWAGNLLHAEPAIFIDPSVSYGHPAQDLAMARLFGGFSEVFFETYAETSGFAFDKDLDVSLDVLTLYPLLVHVALFGDGYLPDIASILTRLR
jgi:protein-ribulosamine 3-kinase